ncbi:MAG: methylamine utilization protein MauE [Deltaproteobacteria bacterium]|nr:methylamine utilization protein MauE [Deltaproteobacteria bacterium]
MAFDPVLHILLRSFLALLLARAAWHKLHDLAAFRDALDAYRMLPAPLVRFAAVTLPLTEAGIAVSLCLSNRAALAAVALLAVYTAGIAINLARGRREIDCGCGVADRHQSLSSGLVARNIVLIAAASTVLVPAALRPLTWIDAITVGAGTAVLALLYSAADNLLANSTRLLPLRREAQHA